MLLLDWWVKLVERDVLHVVRDVHFRRQLLDVPAISDDLPIEKVHREQAVSEAMATIEHVPRDQADRVVTAVCNDRQPVKRLLQTPPLDICKGPR